jgi:hypothetical protein
MREQSINSNNNGNVDSLAPEFNNGNGNNNLRISSTSTTSSGSGSGGGIERRRSNKEYYELPIMSKERGKPTAMGSNCVNNSAPNSNTDANLNPESVTAAADRTEDSDSTDAAPV